MKRILFVDDEVFVLDGLRMMLRRMRSKWEMDFVESGEKALEMMADKTYDVIVSDMRMPNLSGADLLNKVKDQYPHTIRFILSGYSDKDLILKSLESTHQYLSKPCDPETLKTRILRATSLQDSIGIDSLQNLVSQLGELPTLPTIHNELLKLLRIPDVSGESLSDAIKKDIGITAKILKFANSGYVGLKRKISSVSDAVSYLGMEYIRSIILTIGAFGRLKEFKVDGLPLEEFWNRSLQTAEAAKAIAISQTSSKSQAEEAYVSGLLHSAGKLILYSTFPEKVEEVEALLKSSEDYDLLKAEVEVFGASHSQVGAYLLGLWGLANSVVESVHWYSDPMNSVPVDFQPLTAVHVAFALLADEEDPMRARCQKGSDIFFPKVHIDEDYLDKIGLLSRLDDWRFLVSGYLNPNSNRKELVSGMLRD